MRVKILSVAALSLLATACSAGGNNSGLPPAGAGQNAFAAPDVRLRGVDTKSVLKLLRKQEVIGSTVASNGDVNPYGLAYVAQKPYGTSKIAQGDLIVCNFNNKANVQGAGTSIVALDSKPGSKPKTFLISPALKGCATTLTNVEDQVFAIDALAKDENAYTADAKIEAQRTVSKNAAFVEPWAATYVQAELSYPPGDGIFVADASTGKILRVDLGTGLKTPKVTPVISGFAVNHGKPGNILGPSGLQYDTKTDTLYIVDGVTNTVVSVSNAYINLQVPNGLTIGKTGKTFSGKNAKDAHLVYAGSPLNAPVSSTLLPNGNLVIGNTGNPSGTNLMVEIDSAGKLLATRNVDKGAAGALFGMVSTGTTDATTKIYFNDDNANNVQVLEK